MTPDEIRKRFPNASVIAVDVAGIGFPAASRSNAA